MAFERMTEDVSNISKLDDYPNDTNGLTSAELKAEFDKGSNQIKDFLNRLIETLEIGGAESIGINTINKIANASTVQEALEAIVKEMENLTLGAIADGTLTGSKLLDNTVKTEKIANGAVTDEKIDGVDASKVTGAVPIAHGGTGATTTSAALAALLEDGLFANDKIAGDVLPPPEKGRIFFLKVK